MAILRPLSTTRLTVPNRLTSSTRRLPSTYRTVPYPTGGGGGGQSFSYDFTGTFTDDWNVPQGSFANVSGHGEATSENDSAAWYQTNCDTQDQWSQVAVTPGSTSRGGVMCRGTSGAFTGYVFWVGGAGDMELIRFEAGSGTNLDVGSGADPSATFRIEAIGSTITGYVDGVEALSAVDSTLTGTSVGIYSWYFAFGGSTSFFDDWTGGDL